ncbi:MAG TPA: tetratricopeptide repeat protein [Pseudolabrys sp.]|nr:tetratricopeptide repeat protein [Pseudolabrys sp.]
MRPATPLALSSGDLIADRRFEWARDAQEKGDFAAAAELLEQALELAPAYSSAWFALGESREKLGDFAEAIEAFRRARELDPEDRHGAALHLMRLGALPAGVMPPGYVRALFDQFAPDFDRALGEGLSYRAPELLLNAVKMARGSRPMKFGSLLDLGCGTGLGGAAFRPFVDRLTGADLSGGMIAKARAKGLYDRLVESDVTAFLNGEAGVAARYDLILAADVFVYFGDLAPVLNAAARVLAPNGLAAFTVETHRGDGVLLRETLRYAHGAAHARAAVEGAGLKLLGLDSASTRMEKGEPVPGLVAVAGP